VCGGGTDWGKFIFSLKMGHDGLTGIKRFAFYVDLKKGNLTYWQNASKKSLSRKTDFLPEVPKNRFFWNNFFWVHFVT
jgi:hypothetical protein